MEDLIDMTRDLNANMTKTLKGRRRVSKANLKVLKRSLHNMYDKVKSASQRRRESKQSRKPLSRKARERSKSRKYRREHRREPPTVIYVPGSQNLQDERGSFKRTLLGLF
jgi:hypothetical protein